MFFTISLIMTLGGDLLPLLGYSSGNLLTKGMSSKRGEHALDCRDRVA
jgi:hypothetical protein